MSWTPRLSAHNYDGFQSWDLSAGAAGAYASTATAQTALQDLLSGLIALKPGWPSIAYLQGIAGASGASANVSSIALTFAANVTAGSCIVVDVGALGGDGGSGASVLATISIADSQGNVYTLAAHEVFAPGSHDFSLCYVALNCKAGATTVTVTTTLTGANAFNDYAWGIHEYSGVASVSAVEGAATGSDLHSTGAVSLSVTTATAGDLLHLFGFTHVYLVVTPSGGTGGTPLPPYAPPTPTTPPFTQRGNIDYDQIRAKVRSGPATKFLMYDGAGPGAPGNVPIFDASGDAIDSGQALPPSIRTLLVYTTATGNDIAPRLVAQSAGQVAVITAVLRKAISADLVIRINLDGAAFATMTIPLATAVGVALFQTPSPTLLVAAGQVFSWDITASDGSSDPGGVASFTIQW